MACIVHIQEYCITCRVGFGAIFFAVLQFKFLDVGLNSWRLYSVHCTALRFKIEKSLIFKNNSNESSRQWIFENNQNSNEHADVFSEFYLFHNMFLF